MDNNTKTGSPDSDLIDISEDYELQYWFNKFVVSADKLKTAIKAAGYFTKAIGK